MGLLQDIMAAHCWQQPIDVHHIAPTVISASWEGSANEIAASFHQYA